MVRERAATERACAHEGSNLTAWLLAKPGLFCQEKYP